MAKELEKAEIFRANLHRLMAKRGLTLDALNREFDRHGRKWMNRVHRDGLARPNQRTLGYLMGVSKLIGLGQDYGLLWTSTADKPFTHSSVQTLAETIKIIYGDQRPESQGHRESLLKHIAEQVERLHEFAVDIRDRSVQEYEEIRRKNSSG